MRVTATNRGAYHRAYYWQNVDRRRRQRRESKARLGKAHRYAVELGLLRTPMDAPS